MAELFSPNKCACNGNIYKTYSPPDLMYRITKKKWCMQAKMTRNPHSRGNEAKCVSKLKMATLNI